MSTSAATSMKLRQFRCMWGVVESTDGVLARSPHRDLDTALPAIAQLGYDGVEVCYKWALNTPDFKQRCKDNGLDIAFIVFTDGPVAPGCHSGLFGGPYPGYTKPSDGGETNKDKIVATHLTVFQEQLEGAYKHFDPAYVNSHSCKDYFTLDMADAFFSGALQFQSSQGLDCYHEGHRKRWLHSPWTARDFVPKYPDLKLVADLSHWINVAETNTEDYDLTQVIEDCAPQVWHTHCRVGYDHGPQVADPRAPEWITYMEGHERWWDAIWKAQAARGDESTTMIGEHGPPNYQPTLPHSREPVASIWDVNHWVQLRRQKRFAELFGEENISKLVPSDTQGYEPETNPGDSVLAGMGSDIGFKGGFGDRQ